jgi:serine/threonine-protein kinase HipA
VSDALVVQLGGVTAGLLTRSRGGRLAFRYEEDYHGRPDATPLSVSMPGAVGSYSDRVVTPWLWNLLPDNAAVLARWGRQFQVSAASPFSLLSTPVGLDCAGAARFAPPEGVSELTGTSDTVTWLSNDEVAERLRELRADSTAWLGSTSSGQFSLSGAQAKTALISQDGRWGVPHAAVATTHILKPAVAGFDDHDLNEHLCLDAARRAGLIAARTRIMRFGDETAVVVERYDRRESGGRVARIHQEDLCQALGLPPARKYQNDGGPGPAQIVRLLRRVMSPLSADAAVLRFLDALAWNWLIGGTDAHAKNYSLLLAGDQVRLAPLYDVASTLPDGVHERRLRLALKIGGDYDVYPSRNPWGKAALELGMDPAAVISRVRELASLAPPAFAAAAAEPGIAELGRDLPGRLAGLIADRAGRCARLLR